MSQEFNNDTCLPEPSYPCSGAGYPAFVINATSSEHVKMGVDFGMFKNSSNVRFGSPYSEFCSTSSPPRAPPEPRARLLSLIYPLLQVMGLAWRVAEEKGGLH